MESAARCAWLASPLRERASQGATAGQLKTALRALLLELLAPLEQTLDLSGKKPCIVMLAGVNGSGKTTSIGKLARYFQDQGRSVLLAAGDTFRAAAREQLDENGPQRGFQLPRGRSLARALVQGREQEPRRLGPGIAREQRGFDLLEQSRIDASVAEESREPRARLSEAASKPCGPGELSADDLGRQFEHGREKRTGKRTAIE